MSRLPDPGGPVYCEEFPVPPQAVDVNGHVNNVVYVQWMQDMAVHHSDAVGGTRAMSEAGGRWVVRAHRVEYLAPAFEGDRIRVATWVADFRRVRSLRRYRFERASDGLLLARGETDWVFVDAATGRPRTVPDDLRRRFPLHAAAGPEAGE
ncbi:MAG TPA: acyl-CoA thioesterase [Kiritimatiellia bacterium]|nr:acyl-CoA thioesterase [Kiritimatiellia bacterium]HRZ12693.1 acyl-CoA thioesterase [Kiritimatiellia bacterium]HSA19539.1 acyl-CoA thioesterase [Kiritimatiellia bacterium]